MKNRYNIANKEKNSQGILTIPEVRYPEIPISSDDIYVRTQSQDRLDLLSKQFYGNPLNYWIIAIANPNKISFGSLFVPEGTILRIPSSTNEVLNAYRELNT